LCFSFEGRLELKLELEQIIEIFKLLEIDTVEARRKFYEDLIPEVKEQKQESQELVIDTVSIPIERDGEKNE